VSRVSRLALLAAVLLLTACQSPPPPQTSGSERPRMDKRRSVEITPADEEFEQQRIATGNPAKKGRVSRDASELSEGELLELPKFTVTRKGLRKLGLSVVTNTEVALGGSIEWMRIGVVMPGSPAAQGGLFTGIEILAIDNVPIAQLSREDMLHLLFEREAGESVRLLVYSRHFGPLPRFVRL
jgi:hypothetical protein